MRAEKQDVLKRLNYIEGHLGGIRKMVEEDKYCVDILRQTFAVRKAIEKLEALILENHLQTCVPEGIRDGRVESVNTDIPTKTVHLRYDANQVSMQKVEAALDDIGYTVAK